MATNQGRVEAQAETVREAEPVEEATKTYFVSFFNGEVHEVAGVRDVHLTGEKVILVREGQAPAVFGRVDVFSVVCRQCEPPAPC